MASLARSRVVLRYVGLPPSLPFQTANLDPVGGGGDSAPVHLLVHLVWCSGSIGWGVDAHDIVEQAPVLHISIIPPYIFTQPGPTGPGCVSKSQFRPLVDLF